MCQDVPRGTRVVLPEIEGPSTTPMTKSLGNWERSKGQRGRDKPDKPDIAS
jgi:hypothetical protein